MLLQYETSCTVAVECNYWLDIHFDRDHDRLAMGLFYIMMLMQYVYCLRYFLHYHPVPQYFFNARSHGTGASVHVPRGDSLRLCHKF